MANGLRFRHRSSLPTEFDEKEEARKLRRDPNRGKVEGIRKLRNRPDPESDAFLRAAAKEAGFEDGGSFGPGPSRDESWGVNPRGEQEALEQNRQFGVVRPEAARREGIRVEQPPTRTPGRDSNQAPNRNLTNRFTRQPTQGEMVAAGKAPPPEVETEEEEEAPNPNIPRRGLRRGEEEPAFIANARAAGLSEQDIQDLQNPAAEFQGPQGQTRQVSSFRDRDQFTQTRAFDDGGVAQISMSNRVANNREDLGSTGNRRGRLTSFTPGSGGSVRSIPAESFVNPAFTGINSGENIAAAARQDFQRDLRDRQAAERQEQQLQEDANLRLSGNMSLVELADAASRRRNARETLANRRSAVAERAASQREFEQEVTLQDLEQDRLDRRAGFQARREQSQDQREARRENVETLRDAISERFKRFDGEEEVADVGFAEDTIAFGEASNLDVGSMDRAEAFKLAQTNKLRNNLISASNNGVVPENLAELRTAIGNIDLEFLPNFIDATDVRIRNLRGQQEEQINLNDLADSPETRRVLFEIIKDKLDRGEIEKFATLL